MHYALTFSFSCIGNQRSTCEDEFMAMNKSALVAGASGLVGRHCVQALLKEPSYATVTAFLRRPLDFSHPKLIQHIIDFEELEGAGNWLSADDVFCCLGTTMKKAGTEEAFRKIDFDYPIKLAALAQHCGAKQFSIVSSLGADPHSRIFYTRIKGEVEEAVRKISFIALHIFRPSFLLGKRGEPRPRERVGIAVMSVLKHVMLGPLEKYQAIQASDVANAMVRVAQMNLTGVRVYESDTIKALAHGSTLS
jgi:uncharacterized protein YbjT (DUF2867 family)